MTEQQRQNWNKSYCNTHIEYRGRAVGREGGFGELNPSPHAGISLPSQWNRVLARTYSLPLQTTLKSGTKPILYCDAPLLISARRSFAPLQKSRRNPRSYV